MLNSRSRTFYERAGQVEGGQFRHYAAFELIETLSPAAALVLVAEVTMEGGGGSPRDPFMRPCPQYQPSFRFEPARSVYFQGLGNTHDRG